MRNATAQQRSCFMCSQQPATEERHTEENIRAEEAIAAGNLPEAAGILVGIVEKDPGNWRAYNNMGIISWTRKCWNDAYSMFLKSVTLRPDYADALVNLFDASLKLKKIDEAMPFFEKALDVNPQLEEISVLRDSIHEQGTAIYTSKRALAIGVYSPLIEQAQKDLESGNLFQAMELFIRANDIEGPSADAFCGLGIISFYQKKYDDAFVLFTESLKLNPTDPDTYLNLLDTARLCNREDEARKIYNAYLEEFPELFAIGSHFNGQEKS